MVVFPVELVKNILCCFCIGTGTASTLLVAKVLGVSLGLTTRTHRHRHARFACELLGSC